MRDTHGRFVKRTKGANVVRAVKVKGGGLKALTRESTTRLRRQRPNIGPAFTEEMRPREAMRAIEHVAEDGQRVYLKAGGKVYRVPQSKVGDVQHLLDDAASTFFRIASRNKVASPDMWIGVAIGDDGVMLNLDHIDSMDPEVREEMGEAMQGEADELAEYLADRLDYYTGLDIDPEDLKDSWNNEGWEEPDEE